MGNRSATVEDCGRIAELHCANISGGFLSSLGNPFLKAIYRTMISSKDAFCIVAEEEGKVIGFVSGTTNTGRFYWEFLKKEGFRTGIILLPKLTKGSAIRKGLETLLYPAKKSEASPHAELLSIVVDERYRGGSVAGKLFEDLLKAFQEKNIKEFKVVVGANLAGACRFYERMGGTPHSEIELHRGERSRVYVWSI